MKNQKPQESLIHTWLEMEHKKDAEAEREHVSGLDSSTSGPGDSASGEDAQSLPGRDV